MIPQDQSLAILQKLGYIQGDKPTWAAMLLFAREPLRHHIHIGRFKTPTHIINDRQFTDTLFEITDQAMKFIVSHLSVAFEFDGSVRRKERFAFPLPALREALVNAIVHRDYTEGSDIQIKKFLMTESPFTARVDFTAAWFWMISTLITTRPSSETNSLPRPSTLPEI